MRTILRRIILGTALALVIVCAYSVGSFVWTFELLGYPVRTSQGWIGPTPRGSACVQDVGKVNLWTCQDTTIFERHRLGSQAWLFLNGLL